MEIVNGYMCRDCTDVSYAKKNIDPAHPKDGPQPNEASRTADRYADAVQFGGALTDLNARRLDNPQADLVADKPRLDLRV
ncbi:hypothetical protein [Aquidulcibacter sp.]|uniref:hypothetical protein n=1 Tax=Aquidulcibacter sp. TaxID=2052990 RepID=UPI0025B818B0|nr:hypothetical protein [Aquidulcibacter sp.]MCA3692649.1 hypothetical protein [Aquidulcibacter sp.]